MYFISTRGNEKVSAAEAIVKGLAADGGLFVPEKFPQISAEALDSLAEMSYPERAAFIIGQYFEEFGEEFLKTECEKAYASFEGTDPIPLVRVDEGTYILELFHGPTCAFKDVALSLLPALLKKACALSGVQGDILILTATSGDTGKAALEAFRDVEGTKVAVFYPEEGCSKMQRLQMTTQDGNNVFVAGVKGNFDDCQRVVKQLFSSAGFNAALQEKGTSLSSANSINVGRLVPQIAYYFSAYVDLLSSEQIEKGELVDFAVPTGNFGDILAGWYAKKMGLPIRKLICASNRNRVLFDFFDKGIYNAERQFYRTMSPSMDILVSSNLERLLFEVSGRDQKATAVRMSELAEKKSYGVTTAELNALKEDFVCYWASEDDTVEAMYEIFDEYGYPMDTHTGVAAHATNMWREKRDEKDKTSVVILSTANPYKFPQDVLYALSGNDVKDSFKGIKRLNLLTAMKPPKSLVDLRYKPIRFKQSLAADEKKLGDEILKFVSGEIVPVPSSSKK
jgi:threonine synthase